MVVACSSEQSIHRDRDPRFSGRIGSRQQIIKHYNNGKNEQSSGFPNGGGMAIKYYSSFAADVACNAVHHCFGESHLLHGMTAALKRFVQT